LTGPNGWDDSVGYGAAEDQATTGPPIFVVTHNPPKSWRLGPRFSFSTSLADAVDAARQRPVIRRSSSWAAATRSGRPSVTD
jgi:hypothetical protein